ncbi:hypothetical protein Patl1_02714 [Pistacia atlantica]|uniref:Uncharacterized protein n=1 Tax=Pistacia atlantica TaxID=434234 RepID=A0ACC1CAV2_9ROSI|nr:hypothetical protein Patl1_02714 [Pistacia atlantica]
MQHLCVFVCVTVGIFGTSDEALPGEVGFWQFSLLLQLGCYIFYSVLQVFMWWSC